MSVIELKPNTLSYLITTNGYRDDNGDWHEGISKWSDPIECHAVPVGRANEITFADGTTTTCTYTVGRLNPDCREFQTGERVRLDVNGVIREFQVKGFHRYQLQSKIWV